MAARIPDEPRADFSGMPNPRGWTVTGLGLAAIFLVLMIAGVLAVIQNARVKDAALYALTHDVEIEDEAEDIRLRVLEMQHLHRNLLLGGTSPRAIEDLEAGWTALAHDIDSLAALDVSMLDIPPPSSIRDAADRYWTDFRPVLDGDAGPAELRTATDLAIERLENIEDTAQRIDAIGTRLTADGLRNVQQAASVERSLIAILLLGTAVAAVILAVSGARLFAQLRAAWRAEREARQELALALQRKKDFVADASHELRTPLAVIRGSADLARGADNPADREESIARIASEADHMTKLVEDLLFLARSDAGAPPLEREFVPARWLAGQIEQRARSLAEQRGAELDASVEGHGFLEADVERLSQAVLALVDNAARHSPPGAGITLRSVAAGDLLTITVEDRGPGIPAEELPLIFDRFYQVGARRSRKRGGYGLGLPIARSIAEAHGGALSAASVPGSGATMTLTVPLCALPASDDPVTDRGTALAGRTISW